MGYSENLAPENDDLFSLYAEKLAEQGLLVTAAKYCKGESTSSKILRDRLYRSKASQKCLEAMGGKVPEFPFSLAEVNQNPGASSARNQSKSRNAYGRSNGSNSVSYAPTGNSGYSQPQQQANQGYLQQGYNQMQQQAPVPSATAALPDGWMELQDPSSGRSYYANQTTGEVSWDKPQAVPAPAPTPTIAPVVTQATPQRQPKPSSKNAQMASKYGDGFVTSTTHAEVARKFGNVGTANP